MKTLAFWPWLILNKTTTPRICMGGPRVKSGVIHLLTGRLDPLSPLYVQLIHVWTLAGRPSKINLGAFDKGPIESKYIFIDPSFRTFRRFLASRSHRSLDHSFLVSGLHRFGEQLSGASFSLLIFRNLLEIAHPSWVFEVFSFYGRLSQLFSLSRSRSILSISSPNHPWYGGAQIIVSAVCTRDPFLLTQWANKRMASMKLFAHRRFLRLLGSFLKTYVSLQPSSTTILGFNLVTTGKISVTGNAMSRTMLVRFGKAGINNLSYRSSSAFTLIRTKTGCLGLNLTFYY